MHDVDCRCGPYRIESVVARGQSGTVYRAVDESGEPAAVKILDRVTGGGDELRALQSVSHPSVVEVLASGRLPDGRIWLAMPWLEGRTLAHLLATEGPLPLDRALGILRQLAEAVDGVHDAGFVHGDLTPRNLMVDLGDRVTLIDLGSALVSGDLGPALDTTRAIEMETTPRYASPEMASGGPVDAAGDRYAFALIAYESVTGAFPYPDVATPIAMLSHHASTAPTAPSEHRPSLPSTFDSVLLGALSKDPAQRPARAADIVHALLSHAASPRTRRMRRVASHRVGVRRVAMWPVAGAVVVVAALVGVALAFRPTSDGAPADAPDVISRLGDVERTDQAVGIACNLLDLAGFDQAPLPAGFYGGDSTNTAVLAPAIGVDGSGALQLGSDGAFGLFGEIVPIGQLMTADEAQEFVFSAWLKLVDRPTQTGIYIDYLDADYQQLTFERDLLGATTIVGSADGTRVTVIAEAPIGAAYAVPTVFKDGSKGSMVVDEAVFAPAPCGRPA